MTVVLQERPVTGAEELHSNHDRASMLGTTTGTRTRALRVGRLALPALAALSAVGLLLPRSIGTTWAGIGNELRMVHVLWLPLALVVWIAGLWAQTSVQTAALPGLSARRALLLNATGSAVSNIAPMGSALGLETNRRMVRRWGFTHPAFASYVTLTNAVAVLSKLLLPAAALVLLLRSAAQVGPMPSLAIGCSAGALLLVAVLSSSHTAQLADRLLNGVLSFARAVFGRPPGAPATRVSGLRTDCTRLVSQGWQQLVCGTLAYHLLQGLLLWIALQAVGAAPTVTSVVAALAVERVATLLFVLPAGLGVAEVAAAAMLVGLGVPAAPAAAGLLLHRIFVVVLEVPLGLGLGGLWWLGQRRTGEERVAPRDRQPALA